MNLAIFFAIVLFVHTPVQAQLDPSSLASFWSATFDEANLASNNIASTTVAIVQSDGTILYSGGFGYRDYQSGATPNAASTVFPLGQLSELLVGTGVMQSVQRGQVVLTHNITYYLGDAAPIQEVVQGNYTSFSTLPDISDPVLPTVQDCLLHTTGLDSDGTWIVRSCEEPEPDIDRVIETTLPLRIRSVKQFSMPSSYGMTLASMVVSRVTGQSWNSYVRANILHPLGMNSTYLSYNEALAAQAAIQQNYVDKNVSLTHKQPLLCTALMPALGVWATATDVAKFVAAHLNNGTYIPTATQILDADSVASMQQTLFQSSPDMPGVGYVWLRSFLDGVNFAEKYSEKYSYHHVVRMYPDSGIGIIILSNSGPSSVDFLRASLNRFQHAFLKPFTCSGTGFVNHSHLGCLAPASALPNVMGPVADFATRYKLVSGLYAQADHSHTTWQRFVGYYHGMVTLKPVAPGYLVGSDGTCLVEMQQDVFYAGISTNRADPAECLFPFPVSSHAYRTFVVQNDTFEDVYVLYYAKQYNGYEMAPGTYTVNWRALIGFFVVMFGITIGIVMPALVICACCCSPAKRQSMPVDRSSLLSSPLVPESPQGVLKLSSQPLPKAPSRVSSYDPRWLTSLAAVLQAVVCALNIACLGGCLGELYVTPLLGSTGGVKAAATMGLLAVIGDGLLIIMTCIVFIRCAWSRFFVVWYLMIDCLSLACIMVFLEWNWLGPFLIPSV